MNYEIKFLTQTKDTKGKAATVFKLKEKMFGEKRSKQDIIAITDPETNKMVTNTEEIKSITLKQSVYERDHMWV